MQLRPDEIASILRNRIEQYDVETELAEVGTVLQLGDGIARVYGLENAVSLEMLELEHGVTGLAFNLEEDNVGAALFGKWEHVKEGEPVRRTGRVVSVPVGEALIGRIVDPLGNPLDGQGPVETTETAPARVQGAGRDRAPAGEGAAPDRHQGDRLDDQRRPRPARADHRRPLDRQDRDPRRHDPQPARPGHDLHLRRDRPEGLDGRAGRTSGCATPARWSTRSSSPPPPRRPRRSSGWRRSPAARWASTSSTTAATRSCMYDDLSKHADAYRQMSLLLRRPPGREAFPGDVFYLHSRLLERAVKLYDELGGGSLTALPVIETQAGDISAYIPTNVISITDGQIFLQSDLFFSGVRPAVNVGTSVSRVGLERADEGDEEGRRAPAPRPGAVPRARGVRPVRLRARRRHPADARPRRAHGRDAEPAAVPAVADGGAGRRHLRRGSTATSTRSRSRTCRASRTSCASGSAPTGGVYESIRETSDLSDETTEKLNAELERFKEAFQPTAAGGRRGSVDVVRPGHQAARPLRLQHAQDHTRARARRGREAAPRAGADRGDAAVRRPHAGADDRHGPRKHVAARAAAAPAA